jgi:hypothetical protein
MEEERIPKRDLNETRLVDVVQRDVLQLLGIRGWRSKAANRDE